MVLNYRREQVEGNERVHVVELYSVTWKRAPSHLELEDPCGAQSGNYGTAPTYRNFVLSQVRRRCVTGLTLSPIVSRIAGVGGKKASKSSMQLTSKVPLFLWGMTGLKHLQVCISPHTQKWRYTSATPDFRLDTPDEFAASLVSETEVYALLVVNSSPLIIFTHSLPQEIVFVFFHINL